VSSCALPLAWFCAKWMLLRVGLIPSGGGPRGYEPLRELHSGRRWPCDWAIFTTAEGADSGCQLGNLPLSNAVIYDWLDEVLA
jgi:hypothetical protein